MQEPHYMNRSNWLRAAVLGANDGILSTASIAVGVSAATDERSAVVVAAVAGITAGALSMAAGEYVSVSSQSDIEKADLEREKIELETMPEQELMELAEIYKQRGLNEETALTVAQQLTAHNALESHARDELGLHEMTQANPFQAAFASALAFLCGGTLPVFVALSAPMGLMGWIQYGAAIAFLILLGYVSAILGGSNVMKSVFRITIWGSVAMGFTGLVGHIFKIAI